MVSFPITSPTMTITKSHQSVSFHTCAEWKGVAWCGVCSMAPKVKPPVMPWSTCAVTPGARAWLLINASSAEEVLDFTSSKALHDRNDDSGRVHSTGESVLASCQIIWMVCDFVEGNLIISAGTVFDQSMILMLFGIVPDWWLKCQPLMSTIGLISGGLVTVHPWNTSWSWTSVILITS